MIEKIKTRLGITGSYHDALLSAYADDVKAFMLSGGVAQSVIDSDKSIGAIARGVADLWNFGSGDGKFSEVFYQRMTQLKLIDGEVNETVADILSARINNVEMVERKYTYVTKSRELVSYTIPSYNPDRDRVEVSVNGLVLIEGSEYTMNGAVVKLVNSIDGGNTVHFVVRSVQT